MIRSLKIQHDIQIRRNFNEYGTLIDTHKEYPFVARLVANELNVPFIDLQLFTEQLEETYGVEESKKLHLHYRLGEHPYYFEGKEDNTHLSVLGATKVAKWVIQQLQVIGHPLAKQIKQEKPNDEK